MKNINIFFKKHTASTTLATVVFIFFIMLMMFEPRWETNDDLAMSMIIHGYGNNAYSSPQIVFSNVLWGAFIWLMPSSNGILAYSWVTLTLLLFVTWAIYYFQVRLGCPYFIAIGLTILVMSRAIVFPQFTLNAGLATVAAIIGLMVYKQSFSIWILAVTSLLAFIGFLIRSREFALVLLVALPLIPWRSLFCNRRFLTALVFLSITMIFSVTVDNLSYQSPEWDTFRELNSVRFYFTDYRAAQHLRSHPHITSQFGYTDNDLSLISNWFFADPAIANTDNLKKMLAQLPSTSIFYNNLSLISEGFQPLVNKNLLPITLTAGLLFLIFSPRCYLLILAWSIFALVLFIMVVSGRPGIIRTYYPILGLLLLVPLILQNNLSKWRHKAGVICIVSALIMNFINLIVDNRVSSERIYQIQSDLKSLPDNDYYVRWGGDFSTEYVHPVLDQDQHLRNFKWYTFGTFMLAPFSVSYQQERTNGLIKQLLSKKQGVPFIMISDKPLLETLRKYCLEHHQRILQIKKEITLTTFKVYFLSCN